METEAIVRATVRSRCIILYSKFDILCTKGSRKNNELRILVALGRDKIRSWTKFATPLGIPTRVLLHVYSRVEGVLGMDGIAGS